MTLEKASEILINKTPRVEIKIIKIKNATDFLRILYKYFYYKVYIL